MPSKGGSISISKAKQATGVANTTLDGLTRLLVVGPRSSAEERISLKRAVRKVVKTTSSTYAV